jgi:predicted RNA-binding protein
MCLSTVYLDKKDPANLIMEEAATISCEKSAVVIQTMFGERKTLPGYSVGQVNLLEHYVIVLKNGVTNE